MIQSGSDLHTHFFFREMVSNGFVCERFPWSERFFNVVSHTLDNVNPLTKNDKLSILSNFVETINLPPHKILAKYNQRMATLLPNWRLTPYHMAIDFKSNGGISGDLAVNYSGQKLAIKSIGVPYFNYLNIHGPQSVNTCLGIKYYGSLTCIEPERFNDTWAQCEKHGVPIMDHCATGSLHNSNFKKEYSTQFNDPMMWDSVLKKYPGLKICFAHGGGVSQIVGDGDWWKSIKRFMALYENVYFDLSFTILDGRVVPIVKKYLRANHKQDRLVFGSDYFMIDSEKNDPLKITIDNYTSILSMDELQNNNANILGYREDVISNVIV